MTDRQLISKCDSEFYEKLCRIADELGLARAEGDREGNDIRIVLLSGPSCSGKTTAAKMLADRLDDHGRRVVTVSIDDFYYDREHLDKLSARKGVDGIDYDSVDTIDLPCLESFVAELLSKGSAQCPVFDFKTGNRNGSREISSDENTVFVFEGIQAIYPEITRLLAPFGTVSVYIAPQTPIAVGESVFDPNEIREMRRIVRDYNFRGASAEFTMTLWKSVRRNEDANIFPYVDDCTYRIDSTHGYEIGVLKPYLERILSELCEDSAHYERARAVLEKISSVTPIDASLIEEGSLYKEFV